LSNRRSFAVPDGLVGERVDVVVARLIGVSRSFAVEIVDAGGVTVGGLTASKSDRVPFDVTIDIEWEDKREPVIVPVVVAEMTIVYDDDDIVVIDKPPFLAAHPSLGWTGDTVVGALAGAGYRISTSGAPERQGIVHRLDVGTSGLMAVAKSEIAFSVMKRKFKQREIDKTYHAVVQGHPDPSEGTIDAPIGRHPGSSWKFAVTADGRDSVTHYSTLDSFPGASLVEVELETGRTHQIRVHMAAHRHPLVGDELYGADPTLTARLGLNRQWLHAIRLGFEHPTTGERLELEAPYPADLRIALEILAAH
jgi:23S rRNA pseudouridine1911/1915/1917 synthase